MVAVTRAMMSCMREATLRGWNPPHRPSTTRPRTAFSKCLAGGYLGSGDSAVGSMSAGWVLSVGALAVGAQAVTVIEGHCWPRRRWRRLWMFVAVVCIGKHMSYSDIKLRIDRLLSLVPAYVVATHKGTMLLAGRMCG
jgi:hypothetical protein